MDVNRERCLDGSCVGIDPCTVVMDFEGTHRIKRRVEAINKGLWGKPCCKLHK
ncbi:hypothetical protein Tco_0050176, partial [Tanacetum coccineum]